MMKKKSRLLALLLVLTMVCSILAPAAMAQEPENPEDNEVIETFDETDSEIEDGTEEENVEDPVEAGPLVQPMALSEGEEETYTFQIIFTSDLHGAFSNWSYSTNNWNQGLGRISNWIKAYKDEYKTAFGSENSILIDVGDTIQGNGTSVFTASSDKSAGTIAIGDSGIEQSWNEYNGGSAVYPVIQAMNYLGYDAWVLGNHEFNFGVDALKRAYGDGEADGFQGAILSGNTMKEGTTESEWDAYYIHTFYVDGDSTNIDADNVVRVAIIGMTSPNIDNWDKDNVASAGLYTESATKMTYETIKYLKDNDLADVFIAAEHMSQDSEYGVEGSGANDVLGASTYQNAEAKAMGQYNADNLSAFIGAHGHSQTARTINGVKYVELYGNGGGVGRVQITLTKDEDGNWTVESKTNDVSTSSVRLSYANGSTTNYTSSGSAVIAQQTGSSHTAETERSFSGPSNAADVKVTGIGTAYTATEAAYLAAMVKAHDYGVANCTTVVGTQYGNWTRESEFGISGDYTAYREANALTSLVNAVMLHYANELSEYDVTLTGNALLETPSSLPKDTSTDGSGRDLTRGDITKLYKYDNNTLYILEMTGAQFMRWMEWSYGSNYKPKDSTVTSSYNFFAKMGEGDLTVQHGTTYYQDAYGGVSYTVDLTKDNGSRVTLTKYGDIVIGDGAGEMTMEDFLDGTYYVAVNNYRANSQLTNPGVIYTDDPESPEYIGMPTVVAREVEAQVTGEGMLGLICDYIENVKGGEINTSDFTSDWKIVVNLPQYLLDKGYTYDELYAKAVEYVKAGKLTYRPGVGNTSITAADVLALMYEETGYTEVEIISFNDFHGTMDKTASSSNPGAARFVDAVKKEKASNTFGSSIILAAGDLYQGSAMSNILEGKPVSDMLNILGIEYSALGNHEFDWGADRIYQWMEDGLTFLAANIVYKDGVIDEDGGDLGGTSPDFCKPYAIIETDNGLKIGVIGLITEEVPSLVKAEYVADLKFLDPAKTFAEYEPLLRAEGCDLVIALTHIGAGQSSSTKVISGEAAETIKKIHSDYPEVTVDAMITGHSHSSVAGYVEGVPVVQGYYNGRGMGKITLWYDTDTGKVVYGDAKYIAVSATITTDPSNEDTKMKKIYDEYYAELEPILAKVVGTFGKDINSLDELRTWATDLVYDYILRETGESYVLIQNSGGWRSGAWQTGGYKADDKVTMSFLYTIMPFDNEIVLMEMDGSDLLNDLLNFTGDLDSSPCIAGAYKADGKWYLADGTEIVTGDTYLVACNDFMFTGGDKYNFTHAIEKTAAYIGKPLRDAMVEQLEYRAKPVEPGKPGPSGGHSSGSSNTTTTPVPTTPVPTTGTATTVTVDDFNDVSTSAWYYDAVADIVEAGLMNGTSDTTFSPEATLTRSMFVTILYRLAGEPDVTGTSAFSDAADGQWYTDAVIWAAENGITEGYGNGIFGLNDSVTREQMVTFLYRYMLSIDAVDSVEPDDLADFADAESISDWAIESMQWAVGAGLIQGTDTGLNPTGTATRAEAATLFVRVLSSVNAE